MTPYTLKQLEEEIDAEAAARAKEQTAGVVTMTAKERLRNDVWKKQKEALYMGIALGLLIGALLGFAAALGVG